MLWRIALLALLIIGLLAVRRRRTTEQFAVNESENALCKSFTTQGECEDASTECAWCPSQAPQCVMVGCCSEPGKGGLYKTTSECTEESRNLRGSVVAAGAAAAPAVRNIPTDLALKGASVFLNGRPATGAPATTAPSTKLPLPAAVQAATRPATTQASTRPTFQSAAPAAATATQAAPARPTAQAPVPTPRPIAQSTLPAAASSVAQAVSSRPSATLSTPSMTANAAPVGASTSTPVAASVAAPAAAIASAASAAHSNAPSVLPAGAQAAFARRGR